MVEVEAWAEERWAGDAEMVSRHNGALESGMTQRGRKVDYVPVVLPGGSVSDCLPSRLLRVDNLMKLF